MPYSPLKVFPTNGAAIGPAVTERDVGEYPHAVYIPPLGGDGPLLVLVPCKGDDKLYQFQLAEETGALGPLRVIDLPPGTMPRHIGFLTLETGISLAYLLGEASHELHTLVMDRWAGYALSPVTTGPPLDRVYVVPNEVSPMLHNVSHLIGWMPR
jgi:6-phosphogluconolactonase (cycloisomerase 2 family)